MAGYPAGYPSYHTGYGYAYGKKKSGIPQAASPLIRKHHRQEHKRSYVPGLTDYIALVKKRVSEK